MDGGADNDTINGGAGADTLGGGLGVDTLSYVGDTAGVTVNLGANTAAGGQATGDTIGTFENVTGGGGGDTLTGDANANVLSGGPGADALNGAGGNDTENGGDGNDTFNQEAAPNGGDILNGGAGTDTANWGARTTDTNASHDALANDGQKTPAEADNLGADVENVNTGTGADTVTVNGLGTAFNGGTGTDTLSFAAATAGVVADLSAGTGTNAAGSSR